VKETIKNLDLRLLDNEMVLENGVQIIGVNDRQSLHGTNLASILDGLAIDTGVPALLMYHSPADWAVARKHGVDLMLSGHTHNGQIYPFNLLVRIFFKYVNGLYEEEGKHLHVSPGTGTWGPPMRLGSRNQVTLITLSRR
jgi:predicted MPP superfamily phosphohydrolase